MQLVLAQQVINVCKRKEHIFTFSVSFLSFFWINGQLSSVLLFAKYFFRDLDVLMCMSSNRIFCCFFHLFLQFNLFSSFTFPGLECVRRYSSQLNCSSQVFILVENIRANRWMSFCVTGCLTNQHTFLCVIDVLHLHNDTFKGTVLYDDLVPDLSFVHHNKLSISPSSVTSPLCLLWKC